MTISVAIRNESVGHSLDIRTTDGMKIASLGPLESGTFYTWIGHPIVISEQPPKQKEST